MRILVTGGAGYVGSHCVRALCEAGHEVVVYDSLIKGHRAAVDRRAELVVADLGDQDSLHRTVRGARFDGVMHFAAFAEVAESVRHPLTYYRNNIANTATLLEAMRENRIGRIVFSSTCAVYGIPHVLPITEDAAANPINPYGRTKLAIEWLLADCARAWGLGATALRYFNAAGAAPDGTIGEDHHPETHLIPLVLQVAQGRREAISVYGNDYSTPDGTCVRDYVHVEDLASLHRAAIERMRPGAFRAYNVGTGRGVSVMAVIEAARQVTGSAIPAKIAERRAGDPPTLFAHPARIARELGWSPKWNDVQTIIETAWNWHRSNPNGYPK